MTDEWQAEPSYSPDRFYTGSTNKKGFGQVIRLQVPPTISNEISAIIASRAIPEYRTAQDFYRDAMIHRLHYILANRSDIVNRKEVEETLHRLVDQAEIDMLLTGDQAERKMVADLKELMMSGSREVQQRGITLAKKALENGYSESTKRELQSIASRWV